jgi:hypothetical protein
MYIIDYSQLRIYIYMCIGLASMHNSWLIALFWFAVAGNTPRSISPVPVSSFLAAFYRSIHKTDMTDIFTLITVFCVCFAGKYIPTIIIENTKGIPEIASITVNPAPQWCNHHISYKVQQFPSLVFFLLLTNSISSAGTLNCCITCSTPHWMVIYCASHILFPYIFMYKSWAGYIYSVVGTRQRAVDCEDPAGEDL